jgi:hypothetical protein
MSGRRSGIVVLSSLLATSTATPGQKVSPPGTFANPVIAGFAADPTARFDWFDYEPLTR